MTQAQIASLLYLVLPNPHSIKDVEFKQTQDVYFKWNNDQFKVNSATLTVSQEEKLRENQKADFAKFEQTSACILMKVLISNHPSNEY